MTTEETLEILMRISTHYKLKEPWPQSVIDDWADMFTVVPAPVVWRAFLAFVDDDQKGFAPHMGMISQRVKRILFPALGETYEQAKARNSALYRQARKDIGIDRPYCASNPGPSVEDAKFDELRAAKHFEHLKAARQLQTIPALIRRCTEKSSVKTLRHLASLGVDIMHPRCLPKPADMTPARTRDVKEFLETEAFKSALERAKK